MKQLLTFALLCIFCATSHAQLKLLGTGPSFDEPQNGYAKILFLKNKNTAYVHVSHDGEIELRMYGSDHQPVFTKTTTTKFGKLKKMSVKNFFEIGGNLALFFVEQDGDDQQLCRILLDGKDGHILAQDVLAEMGKVSMGKQYAIAIGGVDIPDFFVRRHEQGSSYAVAVYNSFASESDHRIEVILYDGEHKEVSRSFIGTPQGEYKYINLLDLALSSDNQVQTWIYGFNTQKNEGGEAFIATLDGPTKRLSFQPFYKDVGRKSTDGILRYDPVNRQFVAVTQAISHSKTKGWTGTTNVFYDIRKFTFDPLTGAAAEQPVIGIDLLDDQTKAIFGKKAGFEGVLQNFYINGDGSQTLIFEGLRQQTTSYSNGSTVVRITMENAGIVTYDKEGKVVATEVIPFSHMFNNSMMMGGSLETYKPLEHYNRTAGGIKLKAGNQFKSFFYINGKNKSFVLLNDILANEERLEKGKNVVTIQGLDESDAFVFDTDDKNTIPRRNLLFGPASGKKDHDLALFTLSDYDREGNVYATLRVDANGKKKTAWLVWMAVE